MSGGRVIGLSVVVRQEQVRKWMLQLRATS